MLFLSSFHSTVFLIELLAPFPVSFFLSSSRMLSLNVNYSSKSHSPTLFPCEASFGTGRQTTKVGLGPTRRGTGSCSSRDDAIAQVDPWGERQSRRLLVESRQLGEERSPSRVRRSILLRDYSSVRNRVRTPRDREKPWPLTVTHARINTQPRSITCQLDFGWHRRK